MDVGREPCDLLVVGNIERPVSGHTGAERTGIGDRLLQALGVAIRQIQLGALGGQP
jgi:hypothetical protein